MVGKQQTVGQVLPGKVTMAFTLGTYPPPLSLPLRFVSDDWEMIGLPIAVQPLPVDKNADIRSWTLSKKH